MATEQTRNEVPEDGQTPNEKSKVQHIDPWHVEAGADGIDYDRLVKDFGCTPIDQALLTRMEKVIKGPLHPWLRRGFFFSHRSLEEIIATAEQKKPFYLYTGRGPSSGSLHLGHMLPFFFTKWLQEAFDVPLVIQLTDDEKYLFKDFTFEEIIAMTNENARDIVALGFDPKKTFIFRNTEYMGDMYPNVVKIQKFVTANQVKGIFGFGGSDSIGKWAFPAIQAAPSFSSSFPKIFGKDSNYPCLIPCAIDQDPFFRMTRDVAPRLKFLKPAVIHTKFFPALQGPGTKMSASTTESAIFMSDNEQQIKDKVRKFAFSGGRMTAKEHRELGGNIKIDVPYQYLSFFEYDDDKLKHIGEEFTSGRMLSSGIKQALVDVLVPIVTKHQQARAAITDEVLAEFFRVRPFEFANSSAPTENK